MTANADLVILMKGPIATLKEAAQTLERSGLSPVELLRPEDCFGSS